MTVSRQDVLTFLIGLGAAVAIQVGAALVQLDGNQVTDWGQWGISLATGAAAAAGRYVVTELTQRGAESLDFDTSALGDGATISAARLDQGDLMKTLTPMESRSVIKP